MLSTTLAPDHKLDMMSLDSCQHKHLWSQNSYLHQLIARLLEPLYSTIPGDIITHVHAACLWSHEPSVGLISPTFTNRWFTSDSHGSLAWNVWFRTLLLSLGVWHSQAWALKLLDLQLNLCLADSNTRIRPFHIHAKKVNEQNQVVIIGLTDANNVLWRPITAGSFIIHPSKDILALMGMLHCIQWS